MKFFIHIFIAGLLTTGLQGLEAYSNTEKQPSSLLLPSGQGEREEAGSILNLGRKDAVKRRGYECSFGRLKCAKECVTRLLARCSYLNEGRRKRSSPQEDVSCEAVPQRPEETPSGVRITKAPNFTAWELCAVLLPMFGFAIAIAFIACIYIRDRNAVVFPRPQTSSFTFESPHLRGH